MNHKQRSLFLCLSFSLLSLSTSDTEIGCKDPSGQPVSWWVLIKTPNSLNDYVYRDATSSECSDSASCWGGLRRDLSDPNNGPLSRTLQQLYQANKEDRFGYLMYNDDTSLEHGSNTHSDFAHAKGVFATSIEGGFWLIHSVPRFPRQEVGKEAYAGITDNGRVNGQSFLCISLKADQSKLVVSQLLLAHPYVYQSGGFNDELSGVLGSEITSLLGDEEVAVKDSQARITPLQATDGTQFTSVIKSKNWGKELYADLVANVLNADLLVESWNNGRGTLPSSCRQDHNVANVTQVRIDDNIGWVNHKDHSKWAVTTENSSSHAVCIGDINRQNGQKVRGGGTVCLTDENLWRAFIGMVKESAACSLN